MNHSTLLEQLNWRYATKKMDPAKEVPQDKVDVIVEAIRLAPTQITDGSHLLVFAAWDNYTEERIDDVTQLNTEVRGEFPMANEYYENLKSNYVPRDAEINYAHAARQAYIALGIGLVAAAEQEVDSTPMEGFDPTVVDKILRLKERGLRSVVLLPLGYRDPSADWLLPMKKVRKSNEAIVTQID
jgi:nitroreductase